MKIGFMILGVVLLLIFNPLALLLTWIVSSPVVSNYLARSNLNPLFGSYRLTEYAWYAVPGVDIREVFTFDRIVLGFLFVVAWTTRRSAVKIVQLRTLNTSFLVLIGALAVSSMLSRNLVHSWRVIVDSYGLCYLAFFIGITMVAEDKPFSKYIKTLLGSGWFLIGISLVEYIRYSGTTPDPIYRITGPFRYWETLALTLEIIFFVSLYKRNLLDTRQSTTRSLYSLLLVLLGACIVMAQTRTIMATTLIGLAYINLKGKVVIGRKTARRFVIVITILVSVVALSPIILESTAFYQHRLSKRTDQGRIETYWAAANMFISNPIFGVGLKNYQADQSRYADPRDIVEQKLTQGSSCHNSYLVTAAETGLLGLIPLLFLVYYSYKLSRQYYVRAKSREDKMWGLTITALTVIYYFSGITFDPFFEYTIDNKIYYMLLGITLARYQKLHDASVAKV